MILLDTNAYSALVLGKGSIVSVLQMSGQLYLCPPVIAELRLGFKLGSKEEENEKKLQKFLSSSGMLDIDLETTNIYADLAAYARKCGFSLSHNDLWIAAISKQYGARLLTYDKDFSAFTDILRDKLQILH
jgi:predicted nucleic acid-binding protein